MSKRPILPPILQLRFPLNIALYALLPVIVPAFFALAIANLWYASRSSRARIRLLEQDSLYEQKLISILAKLERQVEGAVVDIIDEDDPRPNSAFSISNTQEVHPTEEVEEANDDSEPLLQHTATKSKLPIYKAKAHPTLTDDQKLVARWLNALPELKKELAMFKDVRNSHAMIVKRDVKRFQIHELGDGIVRHWADNLII